MPVEEVTQDSFKTDVENSDIPVIVDFNADWCVPCHMMKPEFDALSEEYDGKLKFASINCDNDTSILQRFSINAIPCLLIMKDGKEIGRLVGFMPREQLKLKIDKILSKI